MNIYKLTKQDLKNINKLNDIEDKINEESERLRIELYKNENEKEITFSSDRYKALYLYYKRWNDWKEIIGMGFVPIIFASLMKNSSLNSFVCLLVGFIFSIIIIAFGLRGRYIRNQIRSNFKELGLDIDKL